MRRLIGAGCLLLSGILIGVKMRRASQRKIRLLTSGLALIRHARRRIALFSTPAADLFCDFSTDSDPEMARAFEKYTGDEIIKRIACELKEDGDLLYKFLHEVGTAYKPEALAVCDYCIEMMEQRLDAAEKEFSARKKLYIALPILLAVTVIILIL